MTDDYLDHYVDTDSGIEVHANYQAAKSPEQAKAINKMMLDLANIPTTDEMCEWIEGFETILELYKQLNNIVKDVKSYCKGVKMYDLHNMPHPKIECNINKATILSERDAINRQDIIKIVFE